ncbi:MAG: hypothetical protein WBF96_01450, partial [Phycisphaerae bacterium]
MAAVSHLSGVPPLRLRSGQGPAYRVREVAWPADAEALFARLARRRGCAWLDSAGGPPGLARWSVLAAEPSAVLVHQGGVSRFVAPDGRAVLEPRENPFDALRAALAATRVEGPGAAAAGRFGPGLYGYLAYDLGPYVEPTAPLSPARDIALPDLWFGFYETVLVLNHAERRA